MRELKPEPGEASVEFAVRLVEEAKGCGSLAFGEFNGYTMSAYPESYYVDVVRIWMLCRTYT